MENTQPVFDLVGICSANEDPNTRLHQRSGRPV